MIPQKIFSHVVFACALLCTIANATYNHHVIRYHVKDVSHCALPDMTFMTSNQVKQHMNEKVELYQIISGQCGKAYFHPEYMKITSCDDTNFVISLFTDSECKTASGKTKTISHACAGNNNGVYVKSMCLNKYTDHSTRDYQYFFDNDIKESPFYRSSTSIIQKYDILITNGVPIASCNIPTSDRNSTLIEFATYNRHYGNNHNGNYYTFQCNKTSGAYNNETRTEMLKYNAANNVLQETRILSSKDKCEVTTSQTSLLFDLDLQFRTSGQIIKCENVPFSAPSPTPSPQKSHPSTSPSTSTAFTSPKLSQGSNQTRTSDASSPLISNACLFIFIFYVFFWFFYDEE